MTFAALWQWFKGVKRCRRCGRKLTSKESRLHGIGPHCAKSLDHLVAEQLGQQRLPFPATNSHQIQTSGALTGGRLNDLGVWLPDGPANPASPV